MARGSFTNVFPSGPCYAPVLTPIIFQCLWLLKICFIIIEKIFILSLVHATSMTAARSRDEQHRNARDATTNKTTPHNLYPFAIWAQAFGKR